MALIEKDLAANIVKLRKVEHDDAGATVPIRYHIAALEWHLEREQALRAEVGRVAGIADADRQGNEGDQ